MRSWSLLFFLFFVSVKLSGQSTKTVTATYTYYAPENVSLEEAKHIALERAKLQSIADTFGMVVSQSNSTIVKNNGQDSQSNMLSFGGSEVKGEWVETLKSPEFKISYEKNMLIVNVQVKGKIREMPQMDYNLEAKILRNGIDDKNESNQFKNGDDMYLSFYSPVSGFLSVYLLDEETLKVYCLLPYRNSTTGPVSVKANKRYVFFSSSENNNGEDVDEYTLTAANDKEFNEIIICFSTKAYTCALGEDVSSLAPREITYTDFVKWVSRIRNADNAFSVLKESISISKKNNI